MTSDLWEKLGDIEVDETPHILNQLFVHYEQLIEKDPENVEALLFFRNLGNIIDQVEKCNLNRR